MSFIPGIYNFCDKWCERCAFTSRCRLFARTEVVELENGDLDTAKVFDQIMNNFQQAELLVKKAAVKFGFDLDDPALEDDGEYERQQEEIDRQVRENHLVILCREYHELVTGFLKEKNPLKEKGEGLIKAFELGLTNEEETRSVTMDLRGCMDVILWYQHFIYVKFVRALTSKWEDLYDEPEEFSKDSYGTAKVALIAVDRSMEAWYKLYGMIPAFEDSILYILALLGRIKTNGELEFPVARKFIRPGLDE